MKQYKILKSILGIGIFLVLVLVALIWSATPKKEVKIANKSKKVTIVQHGQRKAFLYMPLYIALEEGYFKENGLDVELIYSGDEDQSATIVAEGKADFGIGDPIFSASTQFQGENLKTVALLVTKTPIVGYTNKEEISEIKDVKALNNLSISSFPEPSALYTNLRDLKIENDLNLDIKPMVLGSQMAAVEAGEIDIAMDFDPIVAIAEREGFHAVISLGNFLPQQAMIGVVTKENYINEHPENVQKFVNAMQKAVKVFYTDDDISLRVAKKTFENINEHSLKRSIERTRQNEIYPKSLVITEGLWQQGIVEHLNAGDIDAPQPIEKATDNTFATHAYEIYGK